MTSLPIVRAGFEGSGSPRWLMRTLQRQGFDRRHGFALELLLLNEGQHRHGTLQALADGRVDVVDADREALSAARTDGLPLVAVGPYGRILGSLMLHRDYRARGDDHLASLRGARLGVWSLTDKNLRLLQRACRELAGFELTRAATVFRYPSRAELVGALTTGAIDAALVHWHLVPRLAADGHRVLAELPDLADALGDEPSDALAGTPGAAPRLAAQATTFFVMREDDAVRLPGLVSAFIAATGCAVGELRECTDAWHALAAEDAFGALGALDAPHLAALRARWQTRIGAFHAAPLN